MKLNLISVDRGVNSRESAFDREIGDPVAEGFVQVPLDLKLELALLRQDLLRLEPDQKAADGDLVFATLVLCLLMKR